MEKNIFNNYAIDKELINNGDKILISFSGGPDSVFLALLLKNYQEKFNLNLALFHLNHNIRKEAKDEEEFIKSFAEVNDFKLFLKSENIPEISKREKIGIEETGRKIRFKYLNEICNEYNYNKIALGHNANDRLETFFLNVIRGCGLDGLISMQKKRGNLIRPILHISSEEIRNVLNREKIKYLVDYSNYSDDYTRNKIRNNIINKLLVLFPNIIHKFNDNQTVWQNSIFILNDYIDNEIKKILISVNKNNIILDIRKIFNYNKIVFLEIIKNIICQINGSLYGFSSSQLNELLKYCYSDKPNWKISINDIYVERIYNELYFGKQKNKSIKDYSKNIIEINCYGRYIWYNWEVIVSREFIPGSFTFVKDKIEFPLFLRARNKGDFFYPCGVNGKKKVKDFFIDKKIPLKNRDFIPIICDKFGNIIMVGNLRSDARFVSLNNENKERLYILVKELNNEER